MGVEFISDLFENIKMPSFNLDKVYKAVDASVMNLSHAAQKVFTKAYETVKSEKKSIGALALSAIVLSVGYKGFKNTELRTQVITGMQNGLEKVSNGAKATSKAVQNGVFAGYEAVKANQEPIVALAATALVLGLAYKGAKPEVRAKVMQDISSALTKGRAVGVSIGESLRSVSGKAKEVAKTQILSVQSKVMQGISSASTKGRTVGVSIGESLRSVSGKAKEVAKTQILSVRSKVMQGISSASTKGRAVGVSIGESLRSVSGKAKEVAKTQILSVRSALTAKKSPQQG